MFYRVLKNPKIFYFIMLLFGAVLEWGISKNSFLPALLGLGGILLLYGFNVFVPFEHWRLVLGATVLSLLLALPALVFGWESAYCLFPTLSGFFLGLSIFVSLAQICLAWIRAGVLVRREKYDLLLMFIVVPGLWAASGRTLGWISGVSCKVAIDRVFPPGIDPRDY